MKFRVYLGSTGIVRLPPSMGGAIEHYVCDIIRAFSSLPDLEITLIADSDPDFAKRYGVQIVPCRSPFNIFPLKTSLSVPVHLIGGSLVASALMRQVRADNSDGVQSIIHLNEETSAFLVAKLLPKIPKVFTLHNPPPQIASRKYSTREMLIRQTAFSALCSLVLSGFGRTIALSSPIENCLTTIYGLHPKRIANVPLPVDVEYYTPSDTPEDDRIELLYVGRLDRRKNVWAILRMMKKLDKRVTLVVAGDGPEKESMRRWVQKERLDNRIQITGRVSKSDLLSLYQRASCFVFTSLLDAYPRVVIEAAACGLPVVLPSAPFFQDQIGAGFAATYDPYSEESLVNTVELLTSDGPLRRKLGVKARDWVVAHNSYDVFARSLLDVYEHLAA